MDTDEILEEIGSYGLFQKRNSLILGLIIFVLTFQTVSMVFIGGEPRWRCKANSPICTQNETFSPYDDFYEARCNMSTDDWEFTTEFTSIITEAVFDSKGNNRVLSRGGLYNPLCTHNRVCWTETPKYSWDSGLDFLHFFTDYPEWIGIWNTWMENSFNCYISSWICTINILEVGIWFENHTLKTSPEFFLHQSRQSIKKQTRRKKWVLSYYKL